MKKNLIAALALLTLAFQASATVPAKVVSTSDQIKVYNPQHDAIDFNKMCELIAQKSIDMGKKSDISCKKHPNGIVEIIGTNNLGSLSIFANGSDKTVIEYMGGDISYKYSNSLGQSMSMQLSFVNEGIGRTRFGGVLEKGHYRGDIYLSDKTSRIRVGYYIQEFQR